MEQFAGDLNSLESLYQGRFELEKARSQSELFAGLSTDAQLWLATIPSMTPDLARASGFPAQGDIAGTLNRLVDTGVVEASRTPTVQNRPDETEYRMTDSARALVLNPYLSQGDAGKVRQQIAAIGRSIVSLESSLSADSPVRRWGKLAANATNGRTLTDVFEQAVEDCERRRDPVALKRWIDTARSLAVLLERDFDASLDVALQRAARRLDLLDRREQDEIHLRPWFLERQEQIAALRELLEGPDSQWALHLFGEGGVGKTMLLRHFTSRLAAEPGPLQAATARIDFDYLNADYPRLDPGLILSAFAMELRLFDSNGRASELFQKAEFLLRDVQQRRRDPAVANQRAVLDPRFANALVTYTDALRVLEKRVVLIVDTCEELAKIRPDGTIPENVQETFAILEALHDGPQAFAGAAQTGGGVPSLRVIFAGRRPLASQGLGWRCPTSVLPARPYLRLHQLRGFTREESASFLRDHARVPEGLVSPIITRCLEPPADASPIEWVQPTGAVVESRANPYDLRVLADWALSDSPPDKETIATADASQYVELRILKRLETVPALIKALPLIALTKHVDHELLEVILGNTQDAEVAFDRLCEQEWASRRSVSGPDGKAREIALVDERLRRRLRHYYHEANAFDQDAVARVAEHLRELTLKRDLSELDWPLFDTAIRVLENDPPQAASWWDEVEARITQTRGFTWLLELTGFLLAERNAAAIAEAEVTPETPAESVLRPRILASYCAAMLHTGGGANRESAWSEVLTKYRNHPTEAGRHRLRIRAVCGTIAARLEGGDWPMEDEVQECWRSLRDVDAALLDGELASSFLEAAQKLVEYDEIAGRLRPPGPPVNYEFEGLVGPDLLADRLAHVRVEVPSGPDGTQRQSFALARFAYAIAGRAALSRHRMDKAADWFRQAAAPQPEPVAIPTYLDWLPPDDLDARLRCEAVRALYPAVLSVAEALELCGAPQTPINIDRDRLLSLQVRLNAAGGPLDPKLTFGWAQWQWEPGRPPTPPSGTPSMVGTPRCQAHQAIPPFAVTAVANLGVAGFVDTAVAALHQIVATEKDLWVIRHAERALARLMFRMRLRDEGERGGKTLEEAEQAYDRSMIWALDGLDGLKHQQPIADLPTWIDGPVTRRLWWHAMWRSAFALDRERLQQWRGWLSETFRIDSDAGKDGFDRIARTLDKYEGVAMAPNSTTPRFSISRSSALRPAADDDQDEDEGKSWQPDRFRPIEALLITARNAALSTDLPIPSPDDPQFAQLPERIGARRTADLLFEEADLLGLRLPFQALTLLDRARKYYEASTDQIGVFLAEVRYATLAPSARSGWIEQAYQRMRAAHPSLGLPEWARLSSLAADVKEDQLSALAPRCWRPWLVRVIACLVRSSDTTGQSSNSISLRKWLDSNYGLATSAGVVLPAELHVLTAVTATPQTEPTIFARAARIPSSLRRIAGNIVSVFLAFAGVIFVFALMFKAVDWVVVRTLPERFHTTGWEIAGLIAAFAALGSLTQVWTFIQSIYASRWRLRVTFEFKEQGSEYRSESVQADAVMRSRLDKPRLTFAVPPWFYRRILEGVDDIKTPGAIPYKTASLMITGSLYGMLYDLLAMAKSRRVDLPIVSSSPELHGPCWEAILQAPVVDRMKLTTARLDIRRLMTSSRNKAVALIGGQQIAVWARNDAAQDLAREAWSVLHRPVFVGSTQQGRWLDNQPRPNPFIKADRVDQVTTTVHLFGIVERSTSGLRLQSDRIRTKSAPTGDEQFETASAIALAFPNVNFFILQGAVARNVSARLDDDRLAAATTRTFAADLARQSGAAVLVIPPLTGALAREVLQSPVGLLRRRPRGRAALPQCARDIRTAILQGIDDRDTAWETAMDVCVFCEDNWNGRLA